MQVLGRSKDGLVGGLLHRLTEVGARLPGGGSWTTFLLPIPCDLST